MGVFNPDDYDSWYDRHREIYEAELSAIRKFSENYPPPKLEIGVGTGRFASRLGIEYGIDPDEEMLAFARRRGIKVLRGFGEDLPFPDGFFGMILICTTLPFFRDPRKVMEEAHRVLKDNGGLIIAYIPAHSHFGRKYREMGERGDERFRDAHFYEIDEIRRLLNGLFEVKGITSTLLGEDLSLDVVDGYHEDASFVVLDCRKIQRDS